MMCKSFDGNYVCELVGILFCALVKVSLCDVWGQGLYYVHIYNKYNFLDFATFGKFSFLF